MWFYIDAQGQQQGPIDATTLQQLALQNQISPATQVWTEGLEQWISARQVEGLFTPPVVATPTVVPPASASQPIQVATAPLISTTPTTSPIKGIAVGKPNPYSSPTTQSPIATQEGDYPATIKKGGSFGLLVLLYLGSFAFAPIGLIYENKNIALATSGISIIISLLSAILLYVYIYRAWAALQPGGATITPGKAVGFLFIPLFNIIWFFISFSRLPKEWNAITAQYNNTQNAPKFTPWAFICLGIPFINFVAIFIALPQLCRGITFMANLHKPKLGMTTGGGLNFGPTSIKIPQ